MALCFIYCFSVLLLTSLWVYFGRSLPFSILANAMYLPTVMALLFAEDLGDLILQISGANKIFDAIIWSIVAAALVYLLVYSCLALGLLLGWTKRSNQNTSGVHGHNKLPVMGFLRAAGEEIGWRCFLLPCLMSQFTPVMSLTISGIIWGLFHVPVMVLLTYMLKPPRPITTIVVQFTAVALMAYPIGWLAIQSGYSMWASTVLHFVWNQLNPKVLGSIYTQTPGVYQGEQWKINGEGLAGCIVMIPVCALIIIFS